MMMTRRQTRKRPFSATDTLNAAISKAKLTREAERIFMDWPDLRMVALKFCRYISPFIQMDESDPYSLVDRAMMQAIRRFNTEQSAQDPSLGMHGFISALLDNASDLAQLRIAIPTGDDDWDIWDYDTPMLEWLTNRTPPQPLLRISQREEPLDPGPILAKVLANICTTRDMQNAHLGLGHSKKAAA